MNRNQKIHVPGFVNALNPYNPQLWANESVSILRERMVVPFLIHRDFEDEIRDFGDIVNTRKPNKFDGKRKKVNSNVTIQDASATNIAVPLDQLLHTSFLIRDAEWSKSFKDLVTEFLEPAVLSLATKVDRIVSGQVHQYTANFAGRLGLAASGTIKGFILEAREKLNKQFAPQDAGRNLVLTPSTETAALSLGEFITADKTGDDGTALREASIGRLLGFNVFMAQNQPEVDYRDQPVDDVTTVAASAGDTALIVDVQPTAFVVGTFIKAAGDETPQLVTGVVDNTPAGDATLTIFPGLKRDVASGAAVEGYLGGAINFAGNYAAGESDDIIVDGLSAANPPSLGQRLQFGDSATTIDGTDPTYSIIGITDNGGGEFALQLDRPLDQGVDNNWLVALGPTGSYNWAFHRNTLALVARPLAAPMDGVGARAAVVSDGGVSMRIVITYDGERQGHLVTVDMLMGIKVLDTDLGVVMYG